MIVQRQARISPQDGSDYRSQEPEFLNRQER